MVTVTNFEQVGLQRATSTPTNKVSTSSHTSFAKTLNQVSTNNHSASDEVQAKNNVVKNEDVGAVKEKTNEENKSSILTLDFLLSTAKVVEDNKVDNTVDFSALFQVNSVEELVNLLGGQELLQGEQLTMESVAGALGMTETELQQLITKLTGSEQQATDVWDVLDQIDQNIFPILQQVAAAINGAESKLSKKDAQQAVSFLKLVELAAPKTDLLLSQELQTSQTKSWLSNLASQITTKTVEKEVTLPFAKTPMRFQSLTTESTQTSNVTAQQSMAMNKTQTFTVQLPANATLQSQSAKFVEEFQSVMNRAQFASNAAGTRLLIKLYPENLGTIRIELVQRDGMLSAKLLASNALGKQMLESTLTQLKQGFSNQNIQVDRIDVAQALSEPSKGERQFNQQHQSNSQQSFKDGEKTKTNEETLSFEELLAGLEA